MRTALPIAALLLSTGCGLTKGPLEGVWMFEATNPDVSCSTSYNTNLRDASLGGSGGSDWTDIDQYEQSLDIFFARIAHGRSDDAVMIIADEIIPGTQLEGDTWEFAYIASVVDTDGRQHNSGYWFQEVYDSEIETTYTLTKENNRWLAGTATISSRVTERWEEADLWNQNQTGVWDGDLPSSLVGGSSNYFDDNDCLDPQCYIVRETLCSDQLGLVGTWTGLEGQSAFDIENNYTSAQE